jgi:uncharacterized protein (TIGR02300 family)
MAKPEWGVKRQCLSCGARFYDLNHDPIACPECGAVFEVEALARVKRLRVASRAEPVAKVVDVDEDVELDDDEDAALVDDDEDDALIVDEAEDEVAPAAPAGAEVDVEDEDDGLEVDDDVLLDDDEDEAADDLGDLVEDKDEDLRP